MIKKEHFLIVGFIILFVFLHWNSLNAPFDRDEGNYAYNAWITARGLVPYLDTAEQKPPMIIFPYLLAFLINPAAFWPIRVVAAISLLFTALLCGLIAAKMFGRRAGWVASYLTLLMVMFPPLVPFAANTEKFLTLPLMGLLAMYVFRRDKDVFWAGFLAGITILYKQIAILPVFCILLIWLIEKIRQGDAPKSLRRFCWLAAAGFISASIVFCGYFFLRGGWPGFWEFAVVYNFYYAGSSGGLTLEHLKTNLSLFWQNWPAVFLLLAWFIIRRQKGWLTMSLLLVVGLAAIFTTVYSHYYIMLMPILAIIVAAAIVSLAEHFSLTVRRPQQAGLIVFLFSAWLIFSLVWPIKAWYLCPTNVLVTSRYGLINPFIEAPLAGREVARLTKPGDYVFIAGTEQEVLYYAKRLAPTRFGGMYALVMDQPKALDYQKELIADLQRKPPAVIVWVRSPLSWLVRPGSPKNFHRYIEGALKDQYREVGGVLRLGVNAAWDEPLRKRNLPFCSMIIYKKR